MSAFSLTLLVPERFRAKYNSVQAITRLWELLFKGFPFWRAERIQDGWFLIRPDPGRDGLWLPKHGTRIGMLILAGTRFPYIRLLAG